MTQTLEKKAYNESSTQTEIELLESRVQIIRDKLIWYREVPISSTFSTNLLFAKLERLGKEFGQYDVIFDLSEARIPSSEVRHVIHEKLQLFASQFHNCAFVVSKNVLIAVALEFVLFRAGLPKSTVCFSHEKALSILGYAD